MTLHVSRSSSGEMLPVPEVLGGTWGAFHRDWWLGAELPGPPAQLANALNTVQRLWPEKVAALAAHPGRGPGVVAGVLDTGEMLAACETLPSFREVLDRLKKGERSARSEFVLVTALLRLGYAPSFSEPIDGHVLDAACDCEGQRIYFEVAVPERSDAGAEAMESQERLSSAVQNAIGRCRVELEMLDGYSDDDLPLVIQATADAPPNVWISHQHKVRLRRVDAGQLLPPLFDDAEGVQVVVAEQRLIQGESASAVIRRETSDERAKRVFNGEYHHFSAKVPNVLIVNVSAVSGGMNSWPDLMARLLQPTRNRRVGAVVFFDQGLLGPPERIRRRWRILVNPYAHCPIPESLLAGLESLDESAFHGVLAFGRRVSGR